MGLLNAIRRWAADEVFSMRLNAFRATRFYVSNASQWVYAT